ncbi:MAG: hypothetical protein QM788_16730 [Roseateles sp.]|uniref:hypothetical protein n=1 Tax=Roseateles sp. TaxID=1971397 RepID=UPI0039EB9232
MVAVVSGNGLGLNLSSGAVLGSAGVGGTATFGRQSDRVYVNAANGNLVIQNRDEMLEGRGLDAPGLRTYNSQGGLGDDLNGDQWLSEMIRKVWWHSGTPGTPGAVVSRWDEDGSETRFSWDSNLNKYVSYQGGGPADTLSQVGGRWVFVDGSSQATETYSNSTGRPISLTDSSGNSLTFTYHGPWGPLHSVTTSAGEITYYDYSDDGMVTQMRTVTKSSEAGGLDRTLTRVRYGYDADSRLQSVTVDLSPEDNSVADGRVFTTTYAYDGSSKRIASITQSDGAKLSFTYDASQRVQTVTDALGGVTTFSYDTGNRATTVTDALGQASVYRYDASGQLLSVSAPAVNGVASTLSYTYDSVGNVTAITDAEGRSVVMAYDGAANVIRQTDAAGNVVRRSYNARNRLIAETIATSGEPGSTAPATRYVYDNTGMRLRFTISAEGRVTEYRHDSFGQRTSTIQYAGATYALGGWSWSSIPSDTDMANWANAQDRSKTQRVDCAYDWRGQLSRSTSYDSVDAAGNGQGANLTQYIYDAAGLLIKTIDARSGVTQSTYDGLGRVLTTTNALNQVSVNSYDDAGGSVRTTAFNGLVATSTFDKLGRAVSVVESSPTTLDARYVTSANMSLDGNLLGKNSGSDGWDSGAYSKQGIAGGASVSFRPAQNNKYIMVGLKTDPATDNNYASIDWAMYCNVDGYLQIYESGNHIGYFGSYSAGDQLAVTYDGVNIRYVRNGQVLRAVAATITQPLYADSSFYSVGGKVSDLQFERYPFANGVFVGEAGVSIDGPTATKTSEVDDWNSAFRSKVGYSGGASVSFRPSQTNKYLMVGLNTDPAFDNYYASLDLAFYMTPDGALHIYESGAHIGNFGTYAAGDLLSVGYDGTVIQYIKNGVVLRSVTTNITQPLYADSSFYSFGGQVSDLDFESGPTLSRVKSHYDADSRLRMTQDAVGNRQWFLYDDADRLVGQVNALGQLTETVYNKAGQVTQTVAYANLVNLPSLIDANGRPTNVSLGQVRPAASASDIKRWSVYDGAGRLTRSIDPLGAVTEFTYDNSGRLFLTRRYANAVATSSLGAAPTLAQVAPGASSQDQILRSFYDNDGLATGSMDATGALSERQYDAAGRLVATLQRTQFASAAQVGQITNAATTLAQVRPGDSANDRKTLDFYNARGQLVGRLDGEGGFSETRYDASGNVSQTLRYSLKATGFNTASLLSSIRSAAGGVQTNTVYEYDLLNRVLRQRVDPTGLNLTTTSVYDDAGNQLYVTGPNGTTTRTQMDAKGRATATTVDPSGLNLTTRTSYDANGRVSTVTDAKGTVTLFTYDQLGRKTSQTIDPAGLNLITTYAHDRQGNLASITDAKGQVTRYKYDAAGRKIGEIDADGAITEHVYDAAGQVVQTIRYANSAKNMLPNSSFEAGTAGYGFWSYDWLESGNSLNPNWSVPGQGTLWLRHPNNAARDNPNGAVIYSNVDTQSTPVLPGQRYFVSALVGVHRADAALWVNFINSNGEHVAWAVPVGGQATMGVEEAIGGTSLSGYKLLSGYVTVPDGASQIRIEVKKGRTVAGHEDSYLFVANMAVRQVNPDASAAEGWRPVATAADQIMRYKYDAAGRKVGEIDADGAITEHVYDAAGQVVQTIRYANSAKNMLPNSSFEAGAAGYGFWSYDWLESGNSLNPNWSVPGQGTLWLRHPNNAARDNPNGAVIYSNVDVQSTPVLPGQRYFVSALVGVHRADAALWVNFINSNGEHVAWAVPVGGQATMGVEEAIGGTSLSGYKLLSGYVTVPDGASQIRIEVKKGRTVAGHEDSYLFVANMAVRQVNPDASAAEGWRPVATAADRTTRYVYDAAGRLTYSVDPMGSVTQHEYDAAGQLVVVRELANQVPNGGAIKLLNTDGQWHGMNNYTLGTFTAGDVVTATVRFKAPPHLRGEMFLGDAGGPDPYDNSISNFIYGNDGWQTLTLTWRMAHDDIMSVYLYNQIASTDGGVIYDDLRVSSVMRGEVFAEDFRSADVASLSERGWGFGVTTQAVVGGQSDVGTQAQFASFLATLSDPTRDRTTRYVYDGGGRLAYTQDALGGVVRNRYDGAGNVLERIGYARRLPTSLAPTMAAFDAAVQADASYDHKTRFVYDALGRVRFTVALSNGAANQGTVTETVYDALGHVVRSIQYADYIAYNAVTDGASEAAVRALLPGNTLSARETLYTYDAVGRLIHTAQSHQVSGASKYFSLTERRYDPLGRLSEHIAYANEALLSDLPAVVSAPQIAARITANAASDRLTRYIYDAAGRVLSATDGEGYVERYAYDAFGRKVQYTNKNGATTDYQYDAAGRLTQELGAAVDIHSVDASLNITLAAGQRLATRYTYDAFGSLASRTEAAGIAGQQRTTRYEYDALGRQIKTRFAAVGVYDAGQDDLGANGAGGAALSRKEAVRELVTQTVYDAFGQAVANLDISGNYSYKTYDALGRVVLEIDANHNVSRHLYSDRVGESGTLQRIGTGASFTDSLSISADVLKAAAQAAQNAAGQRSVTTYLDQLGRTLRTEDLGGGVFSFDAASGQSGTWSRVTAYTYNAFGELAFKDTQLANDPNRLSRESKLYDLQGGLTRTVDAEGGVTDYSRNAFGDVTQSIEYATRTTPGNPGAAVPDLRASAGATSAIGFDRVTQSAYDRRGLLRSTTLVGLQLGQRSGTNTLGTQLANAQTRYQYDGAGNTVQILNRVLDGNGNPLETGTETINVYDALGRVVAITDGRRHTRRRDGQHAQPHQHLDGHADEHHVHLRQHARHEIKHQLGEQQQEKSGRHHDDGKTEHRAGRLDQVFGGRQLPDRAGRHPLSRLHDAAKQRQMAIAAEEHGQPDHGQRDTHHRRVGTGHRIQHGRHAKSGLQVEQSPGHGQRSESRMQRQAEQRAQRHLAQQQQAQRPQASRHRCTQAQRRAKDAGQSKRQQHPEGRRRLHRLRERTQTQQGTQASPKQQQCHRPGRIKPRHGGQTSRGMVRIRALL